MFDFENFQFRKFQTFPKFYNFESRHISEII